MKTMLKSVAFLGAAIVVVAVTGYLWRYELARWYFDLPAFETPSVDRATVEVEMRDGQLLETHVYRPAGDDAWPTVLIRDPYATGEVLCGLLSRYGYACVHQDVRGRYGSAEGEWYPVVHERDDGIDTLTWLTQRPWQDGNIATLGSSYVGLVQWAMIDEMPDEVKTVIADVSHGDWYGIVQRHGHFVQGVMSDWAIGLHESDATLEEVAAHRPAADVNEHFLKGEGRWFEDYVTNPQKSAPYWSSDVYTRIRNAHRRVRIPILMSAAWHDFFLEGQLQVFEELPSRDRSVLTIRNGSHVDGGPLEDTATRLRRSFLFVLDWFGLHLKGRESASVPEAGYLLQTNAHVARTHYRNWPEPTDRAELFLTALPHSKSCDGGKLASEPSTAGESVSYTYDPEDPVPSRGGSYHFGVGVVEQGAENCSREDVLSFESAAFDEGATIAGSVTIALDVESDAEDSAFTVKLQEKLADGQVLNIRDDITSLGFRNTDEPQGRYEPGSVVPLTFELVPIVWEVRPGSSLRLDVSSSNYPIYNAHPNVRGPWASIVDSKKATQTLKSGRLSIPLR